MEESPWEANSHSTSQEISLLIWIPKVHTVFTRARSNARPYVTFRNMPIFLRRRVISFAQPPVWRTNLVDRQRLFIQYSRSYSRIGGVEVYLHTFLTSALDGGEWSASRPGLFTPRERASGTHWTGGWVGLRASLNAMVKRKKFPAPAGIRTPDYPVRSSAVYHWAIPAPSLHDVVLNQARDTFSWHGA
jgi:hypothetical protein